MHTSISEAKVVVHHQAYPNVDDSKLKLYYVAIINNDLHICYLVSEIEHLDVYSVFVYDHDFYQ